MHPKVKNAKCKHNNFPVQVYECKVGDIVVLRRRPDSYVNATQILKAAGVDNRKRAKILESLKETLPGEHEIIPIGSSPSYRGTWIPLDRGRELARDHAIEQQLAPLFDFIPDNSSLSIGIDSPRALPSFSSLSPLSTPLRPLSVSSDEPLPGAAQAMPSGSDLASLRLESEEAISSTLLRETSTKRKRDDSDLEVEESFRTRLRSEDLQSFVNIPSAMEGILDVTGERISQVVANLKTLAEVFESTRETIIPRTKEIVKEESDALQKAIEQVTELRHNAREAEEELKAHKQRSETMENTIQHLEAELREAQAKALDAEKQLQSARAKTLEAETKNIELLKIFGMASTLLNQVNQS